MSTTAPTQNRKILYRHLGMASNELRRIRPGFTEEDYRHILFMNGAKERDGKYSATTMSEAQLKSALAHCTSLGFKLSRGFHNKSQKRQAKKADWKAPRIAKLNAMWCRLADSGAINDRSEEAMQNFCVRQIKDLSKFQWITSAQLNQAVEILKGMMLQRGLKPV